MRGGGGLAGPGRMGKNGDAVMGIVGFGFEGASLELEELGACRLSCLLCLKIGREWREEAKPRWRSFVIFPSRTHGHGRGKTVARAVRRCFFFFF